IEIVNTEIEKFRNINEQYLKDFAGSRKNVELTIQSNNDSAGGGRFITSTREVDYILQYSTLILRSVTIRESLFIDLINTRLDDEEMKEGMWSFGLTDDFTTPNTFLFGLRNIRRASAPRSDVGHYRQVPAVTVARCDNNNSAQIDFHQSMDTFAIFRPFVSLDEEYHPVVTVTFFSNQNFFEAKE
ncbi:hypothetical protein PFISCL1PPCAC_28601, partial [Pristionchus fissidentatus]